MVPKTESHKESPAMVHLNKSKSSREGSSTGEVGIGDKYGQLRSKEHQSIRVRKSQKGRKMEKVASLATAQTTYICVING